MKSLRPYAIVIAVSLLAVVAFSLLFMRSPTHPAEAADPVLLNEEFTNGIPDDWFPFLNYHRLNPEQWYWEHGGVKFDPNRGGTEAHDAMFIYGGGYTWRNYTVEADFSGKHSGIWFRTHYQESSVSGQWVTGYYVAFTRSEVRLWKIQTPDNCVTDCDQPYYLNNFSNPTMVTSVPAGIQSGRAKIVLSNANIKIYVNDSLILEANDGDFPTGTIGFFSYKESAVFDNVVVRGTDSGDTTPPSCTVSHPEGLKTFQGVRAKVDGANSTDPESGIKSAKWDIYDSGGTKVKTISSLTGLINDLTAGSYTARLTVTNGAGGTSTCDQDIFIYSPDGFNGTVSVTESTNYSIPSYTGALHADNNPKRAVIVSWPGKEQRFVFWHEASYVPYWEFPNGTGANYQFFEGAHGSGELFNMYGRMDANSNVEIIQNDDKLVILKWWYYDVNKDSGDRVGYAEEYFYFFPNGLVLREQELMWGESFEPMEIMIINPRATYWWDNVPASGDTYHMSTAIDMYTNETREYYARRTGDINKADNWADGAGEGAIEDARGVFMRSYLKSYPDPFIIYGNDAFVQHGDIQEIGRWGYPHFVHWPIGWLNSEWKAGTPEEIATYPTHTSILGTNIPGSGPYYWLLGTSDGANTDLTAIGKEWLTNIYFVPCSSSECTLADPGDPPVTPRPGDTYWYYDADDTVCKSTQTQPSGVSCDTIDPFSLGAGWNFITLPVRLAETNTYWLAKQSASAGKAISRISVWTGKSRFENVSQEGGELYGNPVEINGEIPVFCQVRSKTDISDFPYPATNTRHTSVSLKSGWNSISLRSDHVGTGISSETFLEDTIMDLASGGPYSVRQLSYFDAGRQRWSSQIYDDGSFYGEEFSVRPNTAFFVYLEP
jgi:hypothetical protein